VKSAQGLRGATRSAAIALWLIASLAALGQACSKTGPAGPAAGPPVAPDVAPMAEIPPGCFQMGDALTEGDYDELPVHRVCLEVFSIDLYEVTNGAYLRCVAEGACEAPREASSFTRSFYYDNPLYEAYPVVHVTWEDASGYCSWAGRRLPTEAEWEYAARGGLSGRRYPWGDDAAGSNANYWDSGDAEDNDTTAVGTYPANGYGLYDMAGNVYEWASDLYDPDYYSVSPAQDPLGPEAGAFRVVRGGSWTSDTRALRVANRVGYHGEYHSHSVGFRCAR